MYSLFPQFVFFFLFGERLNIDWFFPSQVVQDEWKEFEEEKKTDYTGLKIGQLQLNDDNFTDTDGDAEDGDREDGNKRAGPWSKGDEAATAAAAEAAAASIKHEPVEKKEPGTSKYVSPALRHEQLQQQLRPINLRKGLLPDIQNQELFPTLGAAKAEELKRKKNEPAFEEVRHGGRLQRPNESGLNAPVAVENRYNSLADS